MATSISGERERAVKETIDRIRRIEAERGVTREALGDIRAELIQLANRSELFPESDFPPPEGGTGDKLFVLSSDPDGRFSLYLNRGSREKDTPPHNHTTWAVVVGIKGEEHNKFYDRVDDGGTEGKGEVRVREEHTVRPGTGVCMMPNDIHSIHMRGNDVKMMLHMYGLALPKLKDRVMFDTAAGTVKHFPAHPDTVNAR